MPAAAPPPPRRAPWPRLAICIAALLGVAPGAMAAEDLRMRLVQPRGTELVLLRLQRDETVNARYAGRVWVSGTLVGRWPGRPAAGAGAPDVFLVPDAASAARLPHFVLREPGFVQRYPVRTIVLRNGMRALHESIGAGPAQQLARGAVRHIGARGRFLLERYVVGVDCDAAWAQADQVGAESVAPLAGAVAHRDGGC